jgi:hypothetical protein
MNALKHLDSMIPKIIALVKSRKTYDYGPNMSDYNYTPPLLEQTLYAFIINTVTSIALNPKKYVIFPKYKFGRTKITNPTLIHFTGEVGLSNIPMYSYIFRSFKECLMRKKTSHDYERSIWFIRSRDYITL